MAAASICKNLSFFIFKNKNVGSPVSLSLSLHFFSSQTPTHLDFNINPSVYDILVHKHDFPCHFASRVSSELAHVKNPEAVDSMLSFFKSSGFSNTQLQKILKHRPLFLCHRLEDIIKPKIKGFRDEGFSSDDISKIISSDPRILHLSLNNNIIPKIKGFQDLGFSWGDISKIISSSPRILHLSLNNNIIPKIKSFQDEGFSSGDISKVILNCPRILLLSWNNKIIPSLSVLKGLLGSNSAVISVVRKYPNLLTSNMVGTVVANVEFLKSCSLSMDQIRTLLNWNPATFSYKTEVLRAAAEKAKEMGLTASSKSFIYAIQTIAAMINKSFELRLQAFRDMGFSESDILSMFRKEPRAFCVSIEKVKKITKGLVASGKFDIASIARYPKSVMYSFEKRYEPRMRILRILESRNLIEDWPTLGTLSNLSDAEFFKRFLSPYSDHLRLVMFASQS